MTTPEQSDEACAREVHAETMGESLRAIKAERGWP